MPSTPLTDTAPTSARLIKRLAWLVVACLLLYAGNFINDQLVGYAQDIIRQCGIAVILAVSLNIVNGLTGQFSIGHAGFMAVGAYVGATVTYFVEQQITHNATPSLAWMLPAMLAGGLCAALFGYIVGVPSLRLRGDYLAIVTLGFGEIIRVLLENSHDISAKLDFMGGATGFSGDSGAYSVPHLSTFVLVFGTAALVVMLTRNLKFSLHGLAFMSIREDEIAADAMGVNTTRIKVTAFVLSAFFAGVGGVLFAHALYFKPQTFSFILSINYVIMVVLGGSGSITGATLAAVILTALPELLRPVQDRLHFGDEYRLVIYALLLVLMMLLRPTGVFGSGELSLSWLKRWLNRRRIAEIPVDSAHDATTTATAPGDEHVHAVRPNAVRQGRSNAVVLDVAGLTRRFGGLTAVSEVDIRLEQGELVGLIGPNGAGKTTLFNLLTGVYEPSDGKIEFNGQFLAGERLITGLGRLLKSAWDAVLVGIGSWIIGTIVATSIVIGSEAPALRAQSTIKIVITLIGIVGSLVNSARRVRRYPGLKPYQFAARGISRTFQNIRLFNELTVLENVRLATYCRRRTSLYDALFSTAKLHREQDEGIAKARALLARFNLLRVAGETAKNLPYGDQRRLEIVRALATDPSLLLLDEPAAGMNPQEKGELMSLIRQVRDEFGLTILLIEHDMKLVMGICERIYVLDYGRIIAMGTPGEIRSNPKVIAAYLGEELVEEKLVEAANTGATMDGKGQSGSAAPTV
jgi:branched-chain amino acid transport system permease protein